MVFFVWVYWYTMTMNTFSDPVKIIEQVPLFPGQHVADLGVGSGAYTFACAEKIKGDVNSRVFAVDIQKNLLERISSESKERRLEDVRVVWGDLEKPSGSRLRHDSMDVVLLVNTLFQVEHKHGVMQEAYRVLKPGGLLVLIDWSESFGNIGPKQSEIVNFEMAKTYMQEAGFVFDRDIQVGEHHYGAIARKL